MMEPVSLRLPCRGLHPSQVRNRTQFWRLSSRSACKASPLGCKITRRANSCCWSYFGGNKAASAPFAHRLLDCSSSASHCPRPACPTARPFSTCSILLLDRVSGCSHLPSLSYHKYPLYHSHVEIATVRHASSGVILYNRKVLPPMSIRL